MREERDTIKSELTQLKNELAARDKFIDNLQKQLEEKEKAIVTCENQLQQALEPVSPPAVVVSELDTPATEPETENTESPAVEPEQNPEAIDFTGTLKKGELLKYLNENYPDDKINNKQLTNACYRGGKFLQKLETKYKFGFIGVIDREYRFRLIS